MTIFLTWQLRETLDNISVAELLSPFWFQICGKYNDIKSNPRDLWPETWLLRHWLFFWQLRTTILTITLWPLKKEWWWQHSQFLRCFGLDFPFPLLSISQNLEFCIYDFHFEKYLTAETGNPTQKWQSWIQNFHFEKYLTAQTGNPTQKGIRKCRISILRNT